MAKMMDRKKKTGVSAILLLAVVFAIMFILSMLTPLIADDYNYTMGYASGNRISSLRDIWQSMAWHRQLLNGRVFAHGWVSLVLMYPRWVFAALNGLVAVLFTWSTILFFCDHGRKPVQAAACVWLLIWICTPGFGQIFLWTSGACNYFWGITLAWTLIQKNLRHTKEGPDWRETLLLLPPCFAAGAWSEHISFAMLMVLFLHMIGKYIREKRVFPGDVFQLLVCGCGYLYLMLAPASRLTQRLHDAGDPTEEGNLSRVLSAVPGGWLTVALALFLVAAVYYTMRRKLGRKQCHVFFTAAAAFVMGCAAVLFAVRMFLASGLFGMISTAAAGFFLTLSFFFTELCFALKENEEKNTVLLALNLFISGMCAFALFAFGEYLPPRAFCAPVLFALLGAVLLAEGRERTLFRERTGLLSLCAAFALTFALGLSDIVTVYKAAVIREQGFAEAAAGNLTLVTSPYPCRSRYSAQYANADLAPDADWPNGAMADYYGIVRIIVVEDQ